MVRLGGEGSALTSMSAMVQPADSSRSAAFGTRYPTHWPGFSAAMPQLQEPEDEPPRRGARQGLRVSTFILGALGALAVRSLARRLRPPPRRRGGRPPWSGAPTP